jgi:uncharacterized protein YyaL (SSP411 family)
MAGFGMNQEDADAVLKDVVSLGQRRRAEYVGPTAAQLRADEPLREARSETIRHAARAVKVTNQLEATQKLLAELKAGYTQAAYRLNDQEALAKANGAALEALAKELAKATGRSVKEVLAAANGVRKQVYDQEIGERLSTGYLVSDPRLDPEIRKRPAREWYFGPQ